MRRQTLRSRILLLAVLLVVGMFAGDGQAEDFRETYEGLAVVMGTSNPPIIPAGTRATVQVNITRWTTAEERDALFVQLVENGQPALVKALQDSEETGWVINRSTPTTSAATRAARGTMAPSYRLRYAWQHDLGGGKRRIVAALDRPIGFAEASSQPRWRDYDVTLIILDVDEKGSGEGQIALGVRLEVDQETRKLMIENFGSEPVRLTNVQKR